MLNHITSLMVIAQAQPEFPVEDIAGSGAAIVASFVMFAVMMVVAVVLIASMWKIFTKAGEAGWMSLIPILNVVILTKIAGKEMWWVLLLFVPIANLVATVVIMLGLADSFGKDALWGLGLLFLPFIFYPLLGFGSAQYRGQRQVPAGAY